MTFPRTLTKPLQLAALLSASLLSSGALVETRAQSRPQASVADEAERGIELYKQGDDKGAIETLQRVVQIRGEDLAAWHYLGLAYGRQGKASDARKAHEKAARGADKLLELLFSSDKPLVTTKSEYLLELASESASEFIKLSPDLSGKQLEEWSMRVEMLRDYARLPGDSDDTLKSYSAREVDTKVRIISRPNPVYPREARGQGVVGTVVLRAIFAADGKVRNIRVVKDLPNGITFSAIRAARQIKFIPATLSGTPVSQYVQIEYNFNLY
jgi:TonB family protein